MILNLGSGELPIKDAVNVDCYDTGYQDEIVDLTKLPWKWQNNSIDDIYMLHSLEHFPNPLDIIKECHRIIKKGGFLFIVAPHSSSVSNIGTMGHYRTFGVFTFRDYLGKTFYHYDKPMFTTQIEKLLWLGFPRNNNNQFGINFSKPSIAKHSVVLRILNPLIQGMINLSPIAFERLWCHYVGGADEVVWKGIKI